MFKLIIFVATNKKITNKDAHMNILEAINQKSFKTNYEKVLVNLLYTQNWFRDKHQNFFKEYGIRMQHYNILRILKGKFPEASSPGEIKEVMLDKAPDLTRLLDKLVDMDLVDRQLCPENRRKMDILITPKGIELLEAINREQDKMRKEDMNNITEEEAEQLSNLLDKFRG